MSAYKYIRGGRPLQFIVYGATFNIKFVFETGPREYTVFGHSIKPMITLIREMRVYLMVSHRSIRLRTTAAGEGLGGPSSSEKTGKYIARHDHQ